MINFSRFSAFRALSFSLGVVALGGSLLFTGCQTPSAITETDAAAPAAQILNPGDRIKVAFPQAGNLDTVQTIRMDGKINLLLGGEIAAAGKTPSELERDIIQLIGSQLLSKEVNVSVEQSSFAVFITGAVMRPGKINPTHSLTLLEAVMEAGGFDAARANLKAIRVLRQQPDGHTKIHVVNLQDVLDGKSSQPFYLRHNDIVMVDEKFIWF